ncbi:MAG: P-loop NTPase fold protein [Sphingomonas sp.]
MRSRNEGEADNGAALFESLATSRQLKLDTARSVMSANAELNAARKATAQAELDRAEKLNSKNEAFRAFFAVTVDEVASSKDFAEIRTTLASLGLAKADESAEELQTAIDDLTQTGGRSRLFWEAARAQAASPYAWFAVVSLLLVPIAIPAAINWALAQNGAQATLPPLLTGASAAMMTAAGLIKAFLGKVKPALDQAERFAAKVHQKMGSLEAQATSKEEKALANAKAAAAEAEKQLAAAQERLRLAAAQAADAQNRYTAESARGRLNRFIRERLADGTYGKHLGLIATIRKDFEQLTALVSPSPENKGEEARFNEEEEAYRLRAKALIEEAAAAEGEDLLGDQARSMLNEALTNQKPPRVFERIVLYIDDLDRCPPDRVVEVLQAVHMLLSFRLFVVFVAVDARWVTCALREVYEHQLDKGGNPSAGDALPVMAQSAVSSMATAEDYMEKIFQIPYWVRPIQGEAAGGFMRKLVQSFGIVSGAEESREIQSDMGESAGTENDGSLPRTLTANDDTAPDGLEAQDDDAQTESDVDGEMTAEQEEVIVAFAKAAKLSLIQEDMEALAALAPVVGDSPRRIKRFFNTYLLIQSIASVAVNEESADLDPETRAHMTRLLDECSLAQQTLGGVDKFMHPQPD